MQALLITAGIFHPPWRARLELHQTLQSLSGYTVARLNRGLTPEACCDVSPARATTFAQRHHIPLRYTEYRAMLDEANLDAAYLAVPHHLHASLVEAAIEWRLPLFPDWQPCES